jgi:hypothetical protein
VQRPTLGDREDGDMLGQPDVLQIKEPGVLNAQTLVAAGGLAHRRLPGPIIHRFHPPWKGGLLGKAKRQHLTCMF